VDREELAFAGVARQAQLVRDGEVSSRELVELYLERIERFERELNAFVEVLSERALAEADQADARRRSGDDRPLLGVPIAIKDSQDLAGEVTSHGTVANATPVARDSELVARLRNAGAVPIGKTRLSELAIWPFTLSSAWGATRNPWDLERTPGGSSGGSAAATAAGLAAAGTASDGGGSIRLPAACCGLVGLKPQRGRVSLMPDAEHWQGLTSAGFVTRTVADTGLLLDTVAGPAEGDADTPSAPERPYREAAAGEPGSLRIGLAMKAPLVPRVSREVRDAARRTAEKLESLGHRVEECTPPYGELFSLFLPRWGRGIHEDAERMEHPHRLERRTRVIAGIGGRVPRGWVHKAREREPSLHRRLAPLFERFDALLTPHPAEPAIEIDRVQHRSTGRTYLEAANFVAYDVPWNITGQPAMSVPAGSSRDGLPLSVQLVGRENGEPTLIALAAQLEAELRCPDHRPPLT
jgi:amidase